MKLKLLFLSLALTLNFPVLCYQKYVAAILASAGVTGALNAYKEKNKAAAALCDALAASLACGWFTHFGNKSFKEAANERRHPADQSAFALSGTCLIGTAAFFAGVAGYSAMKAIQSL